MARIARITLHPIKSLDGVAVEQASVSQGGALADDRVFALVDLEGKFVNGKRNKEVHRLRSELDLDTRTVTLYRQGENAKHRFQIEAQGAELEGWLSGFFGFPVRFIENSHKGFPDDLEASGPTLLSSATLVEVSAWFKGIQPDKLRLRLRANLEIEGVPPFWEDRLFHEPSTVVEFAVGPVCMVGINPCQRCVVPSRDPSTGEPYPNFQKIFAVRREETLPSWAARSRFNHFYRLSVNTRIPSSESGKRIRIGDEVRVIGVKRVEE
ncbi:MAG: MOSC domain-containing protein [Gammaproteobacteria bacterium]